MLQFTALNIIAKNELILISITVVHSCKGKYYKLVAMVFLQVHSTNNNAKRQQNEWYVSSIASFVLHIQTLNWLHTSPPLKIVSAQYHSFLSDKQFFLVVIHLQAEYEFQYIRNTMWSLRSTYIAVVQFIRPWDSQV